MIKTNILKCYSSQKLIGNVEALALNDFGTSDTIVAHTALLSSIV